MSLEGMSFDLHLLPSSKQVGTSIAKISQRSYKPHLGE
jgi:hypothetical protein